MAGFTAERDMGTEGAGSADTAVRDAIDEGLIPGPRLRLSGNAIDILGGHEDANRYNPAQHVLSNADYANSAKQIVEVMREQFKEGSDFRQDLRDRPGLDARRRFFDAVSIHGGAVEGRRGRSGARGPEGGGPRDGRAGHALCSPGRRGIDRSRSATQ